MHVDRVGSDAGAPLLLLHGGGVAGWMWRPLLERLGGASAIVPDLPGHGRSRGEQYPGHGPVVQRLAALLEPLGAPAVVAGFSLGAQLAVQLAAERPELVRAVAVVSAQAKPLPFERATLALLRVSAPLARQRWFARLQARELRIPAELLPEYLEESAAVDADNLAAIVGANLRFTVPAGWGSFPGTALLLAGTREPGVVRDSARLLHEALPGSRLELLPGARHEIPLEHPAWLAERLAPLLAAG